MPRFFFHIRNRNGLVKDLSGLVCANLGAAQMTAGKGAGFVGRATANHSKEFLRHSFEVMDDAGRLVLKVPFSEIGCR